MAFTTLTMRRKGQTVVDTFGPNHCGLADRLVVTYECEITILAEALDSRGFMIDQLEINTAFQSIGKTSLSCELLSKEMARVVIEKLLKSTHIESILRVACTISPMPEASMTFVWQKHASVVR
jgi:hypothetical protein